MLRAGALNRRFVVQSSTDPATFANQDSYGEPDLTWSNETANAAPKALWGELKADRGSQINDSGAKRSEQRYIIATHYREDLTIQQILKDGSTSYEIEALDDPDGRRIELHIGVVKRG